MNCPACGNTLTRMEAGTVTVDACQDGCAGVWFDRFELIQVDEGHESAGEILLRLTKTTEVLHDPDSKRNCPHCEDMVMMRHFFGVKHEIEVDECAKCAGMWLDAGELATMRSQYANDEERKQAAHKYLSEVMAPYAEQSRATSQAKLEKAQKLATAVKFICPTYWIPGKQKWGAF